MKSPQYTVEIERLVLTGLDLTPAQAEQVRTRLAGELQTSLAQRSWVGGIADISVEQLDLPGVSFGPSQDCGGLAGALAQGIAQALPGTRQAAPRRAEDG
jgi:hypothetical protein